jgi:protein-disulfide isomerase
MTTPSLILLEVDSPEPRRTATGAVVLDWWCDLACPDCAESAELIEEVRDRFGDEVDVRLRHFPLTNHVWAVAAAQCQLEAEAQGQGRAYAAHALATQAEMEGPADYVDLLAHLGLDEEAGALALFDGRHASAVRADHDRGRALGVAGTPTFVVDGLLVGAGGTLEGALDAIVARVTDALGRA